MDTTGAGDAFTGALAAVWIVLYHGVFVIGPSYHPAQSMEAAHTAVTYNPLYALLVEGHTAVALFMVLSGFIFTVGSFEGDLLQRFHH